MLANKGSKRTCEVAAYMSCSTTHAIFVGCSSGARSATRVITVTLGGLFARCADRTHLQAAHKHNLVKYEMISCLLVKSVCAHVEIGQQHRACSTEVDPLYVPIGCVRACVRAPARLPCRHGGIIRQVCAAHHRAPNCTLVEWGT
eukprot:5565948-Amphidinium_carterae.1